MLKALDRPVSPLHTNGSENDIRCQVTKRKISGDTGCDCRDAFPGLTKTRAKLGISFWDYLGNRLSVLAASPSLSARPLQPPLQVAIAARTFATATFS